MGKALANETKRVNQLVVWKGGFEFRAVEQNGGRGSWPLRTPARRLAHM